MSSTLTLYSRLHDAAYEVERKLHASACEAYKAIDSVKADYSGSDIPEPQGLSDDYWSLKLRSKLPNVLAYLETYAYIISNAVPEGKILEEITLLDYGGGGGYMSLLAKQAGIGNVVYLDIDPGAQTFARTLGKVVKLEADHYLCGNEEILLNYPQTFDTIVSSDVIEHVYSIESVVKSWSVAASTGAKMFHQTGANYRNLYMRWYLSKIQREAEEIILPTRQKFITESFPALSDKEILVLAEKTRGLNAVDIQNAVKNYQLTNGIPEPEHETNTCELSGYWIERFMEPERVASELRHQGFESSVEASRWGIGRSRLIPATIKKVLNLLAGLSLNIGLRVTAYYCIAGKRIR